MKFAIVFMALLAFCSVASVRSGTSHYSDAVDFDNALRAVGVYTEVSIERYAGGYQYIAWFDGDYYDISQDGNEAFSVALAAGVISSMTSWSSVGAVCVYEDEVVGMFTADCRYMVDLAASGYSDYTIYDYYLRNSYVWDRWTTDYPAP